MMCLGLDLGTGFAKLAGHPAGSTGAPGVTMIPAAVTIQRLTSEIPYDPRREPRSPGAVQCDGFPPMLGTAMSASRVAAWQNRTPGEAARSFLRCVLDGLEDEPGRTGPGAAPASLVVAVPPAAGAGHDRDDLPSPGAEISDILTALGRAPGRLVPAPVAVLLWLRHIDPDLSAVSRFVVVDAGAGSVELSLCLATGRRIRVVDSVRLTGRAAWGDDSPAGAGERPPTLAECLVGAVAATAGARVPPAAGPASVSLWRAFENELADDGKRDRLDVVLQQASAARHRHGGTVALRFGGLEVTASQLLDACEPLARHAATALGQLLVRQAEPGWLRFGAVRGTRIVLTGGLSVLWPLRAGLLASLELDPDRPDGVVIQPAGTDRLGAVARGAALVAAGRADPGDRYPHALRLEVSRVVRDRIVTEYLELAAPGSIDLDLARTLYLTHADGTGEKKPVLVTVRPAAGPSRAWPIPVQLIPDGDGETVRAVFRPAAPPEPGVYRVGVRGGPAGPAVVLQRTDGGEQLAYRLAEPADLSRDINRDTAPKPAEQAPR